MNKSKGFTIIELLVVIAIIAVLAAVVMVNVTSYINKSKDASIKANIATIRTAAAAFYDEPSSFTGLGADPTVMSATADIEDANGSGTAVLNIDAAAYCFTSPLKAGTVPWCIDSTGYVGDLALGKCTGTTYTCQ